MGFFDKVKNMFTEEVEDDVKVEQIKRDVTHVAIESPGAKTPSYDDDTILNEYNIEKEENKPVFFDDNDFRDLNILPKKEEKVERIEKKEIYGIKAQEKEPEEKKIFKPTPIISPVYGILDKNYHKEDIVTRKEVIQQASESKEPSIDSIRNKAYGTLEDELENTLFGNNSILFKKDNEEENKQKDEELKEIDENLLSDLTDDISKKLDELIEKKEKYSDNNEKKDSSLDDEDLLGFIDSTLYKNGDEE